MPLTELVHYFNKRQRLARPECGEEGFEIVGGRVRMHFAGRALGTLFQPVMEPDGLRVIGHEAHLQVLGCDSGKVPAQAIFLETRDDAELVHLDRTVRTLHALNFLLEREQQGGFLSLNVHPQLIRSVPDHHGHVFEGVLARCGLTPDRIVLELADDGFGDVSRLAVAIAEYRERGYRVAIDNFGRHSADLDRLEALAPDIVKLDRCLIGHAGHLGFARQVLGEMCAEIRRLGMRLVSQSIESPQQLQAAMASGADLFQGYLIGRPSAVCLPLGHAEPRVCEMSA